MWCFDLCALHDKSITITGFISHAPFLIEILIEHVYIIVLGSNGYCCLLEIDWSPLHAKIPITQFD